MLEAWRKLRVLHRIVGYKVAFKQPLLREKRGGKEKKKEVFPCRLLQTPFPPVPQESLRASVLWICAFTYDQLFSIRGNPSFMFINSAVNKKK